MPLICTWGPAAVAQSYAAFVIGQKWKVGMGNTSSPTYAPDLSLSYQVGKTWMHGRLTTRIQMYYYNYRL